MDKKEKQKIYYEKKKKGLKKQIQITIINTNNKEQNIIGNIGMNIKKNIYKREVKTMNINLNKDYII